MPASRWDHQEGVVATARGHSDRPTPCRQDTSRLAVRMWRHGTIEAAEADADVALNGDGARSSGHGGDGNHGREGRARCRKRSKETMGACERAGRRAKHAENTQQREGREPRQWCVGELQQLADLVDLLMSGERVTLPHGLTSTEARVILRRAGVGTAC